MQLAQWNERTKLVSAKGGKLASPSLSQQGGAHLLPFLIFLDCLFSQVGVTVEKSAETGFCSVGEFRLFLGWWVGDCARAAFWEGWDRGRCWRSGEWLSHSLVVPVLLLDSPQGLSVLCVLPFSDGE